MKRLSSALVLLLSAYPTASVAQDIECEMRHQGHGEYRGECITSGGERRTIYLRLTPDAGAFPWRGTIVGPLSDTGTVAVSPPSPAHYPTGAIQLPNIWVTLTSVELADERMSFSFNLRADARTWSLYCALYQATADVTGESHHRQPALQVVRRIVAEVGAERIEGHRLMDFNNHPETTLAEIHAILDRSSRTIRRVLSARTPGA
ncbi:MAG: hypothetical protein IID06_07290 [Gemmatimonadetes bacterium]|nr:hypothetical protein [Gemmatimonadota bacterium]